MALWDNFTRGLGLIGSAVGGNTQPLQGAVQNTLGVDPAVWDQAMRAAGRPMYQNLGTTPDAGLLTPVRSLGQSIQRASDALGGR